ncbi:hypothetical protein D7X94_02970 [Acutalibacter sp. 1XD8-33]|uniref:exopolysaccharide Pel transporter PelG n=1 Tax=Acutalibacter sp. 1XD8-33 TaxID=2320081 RepID=UPI000EA05E3F|nr:exopolysaccharide Pel transporter PelG [Acutalibacter sp. 1XD8-33]RKJ41790.1 hypothetical protein D7X94_02970 [Acutalibacter sp. 1XD8-33]
MAGIGVRLNRIFEKQSIAASLVGFVYGSCITVAPMVLVIGVILLMEWLLGFDTLGYYARELFSCTVLYTFIFALLSAAPFNAVLSKYMQDAIFEERYQDILPCYYLGLVMNLSLSCLLGIPFCLWEHFVGGVGVAYVFTGFCGYVSLVMVFYSMIYLSICKDYGRISLFFLVGMGVTFGLALLLRFRAGWGITESMLFSLTIGFFLIAVLEYGSIRRYFAKNSNRFWPVLRYFKKYWHLVAINFFYILGLYIHNFVFWTTDMRMVVADSFVCNQPYDMATCLAMFTNISATVIFIARIEMHFHEKYKAYSEAVIGGKLADIQSAKRKMFREIAGELLDLARIQFIISVVVYLGFVVILPRYGFAGMVMRIYPCLAAGYFILFLMYAGILFLYYFNDMRGAVLTAVSFCVVTFLGSILSTHLPEIWYGLGVVAGSFVGWCIGYGRLRWVERHLDSQVFCKGNLIEHGKGLQPSSKVYEKALSD